jgi:preprotein translocase subunit SecA
MLGFLKEKFINIFGGTKSNRDIKGIEPLIPLINQHYEEFHRLSNDELRAKTTEFKIRINEYVKDINKNILDLNATADEEGKSLEEKDDIYTQVDALIKSRDDAFEEILNEILPEAFAVVKQAAKRFREHSDLKATATELDRDLCIKHPHITIEGNTVTYKNRWIAAGNEIVWDMIHYDVQLIGGIVLHQGKISEMATGEGKTLVATLPAYLNALAGQGVHIVTVNDYLAKRDSEWMGTLFNFLGITCDCIDKYDPHTDARKAAYLADITYGTNNEFGFDYLRDNMAHTTEDQVQRKLHYAMVDEVDSVLVDDARTPLIISGPTPRGDEHEFHDLKPKIERLVEAQKKAVSKFLQDAKKSISDGRTGHKEGDGGMALLRAQRGLPKNSALIKFLSEQGVKQILQKTENYYLQDQQKEMPLVDAELYFTIDEKNNQIDLTEKGIDLITSTGDEKDFFLLPDLSSEIDAVEKSSLPEPERVSKKDEILRNYARKSERLHSVNQLLKAFCLFEKDVEYVVIDGKVKIVDESTGRIMEGRRYSDGLHQAIEAKENVQVEAATQTFATVTLQNFFRMYHKLAGMTGTAETEAGEFWEIYKLDTVVIPTNKDIDRDDKEDLIFKTKREKYNAIIDEISKLKEQGRPVLVGTSSVEVSELLSRMLNMRKISHNVLNAKQHQREADIVAEAGKSGTVTIATNMAGRGTDIKLGTGVKDAGGLAIVGSERHDSRRVDRQLRGRAGRQGDPGTSQFYVSLEDDLMRLFGSDRLASVMDKMGHKDGEVLQHSMLTKSIERAQRKMEENNFGIRKRLLEYDDVMNAQREVVYKRRQHALNGDRIEFDLINTFYDLCEELVNEAKGAANYDELVFNTIRFFSVEPIITKDEFDKSSTHALAEKLYHEVYDAYRRKSKYIMDEAMPVLQEIRSTRGSEVKNVLIPFSDGSKNVNILVNMDKALSSSGREIVKAFEQNIILAFIDQSWKDHLRAMDELKQSVQLATIEQKDPLLIYKFEAFKTFKEMISDINREVCSFLMKGTIPQQDPQQIRQARLKKEVVEERKRMQLSRGERQATENSEISSNNTATQEPKQPAKREVTVGRNDPCPCGSGKKFKHCHGSGL